MQAKAATHPPATDPETEIAELSREWVEAELLYERLVDEAFRLEEQAEPEYPERPDDLYSVNRDRDGNIVERSPLTRNQINHYFDVLDSVFPAKDDARNAERNRLLTLLDDHLAERRAVQERFGLLAIDDRVDECGANVKRLEERILASEAVSIEAVILKLRLATRDIKADSEYVSDRAVYSALDAAMRLNSQ